MHFSYNLVDWERHYKQNFTIIIDTGAAHDNNQIEQNNLF